MGHLLGYARVSTTDQQPQLQVDALELAGCYRVFTETPSGARSDRPTFERVLDHFNRAALCSVTNQEAFSSEHQEQGHACSAHTSGKRHRAGWGNLLDLPMPPPLLFAYYQQPYT